jgi:autotransporter passenger strand-loop-strand repeat protein
MTVIVGGQTYNVSAGQPETGDFVENLGVLNILSGGVISSTLDEGLVTVMSGGSANGTIVRGPGGDQDVYGSATNTIIEGGVETVESGGVAVGTTFAAGGRPRPLASDRHRDH